MSGRITAKRVALITQQMTSCQTEIIEHLAITKVLTGEQLRRLTGAVSVYQRRTLQRDVKLLIELRVIARLARRVGGIRAGSDGGVLALDVVGQRIIDGSRRRQWRRPWTPSIRILDHALTVADLYVRLHAADQAEQLELLDFTAEPHCWRSFTGTAGGRQVLKPDAHAVIATGEDERHAWLEIDRSTESLTWITQKAKAYARYHATGREQATEGVFPICLWIAPNDTRASALGDALSRLPADQWHLHQVTTTDRAVEVLAGEHQPLIEGTKP